MQGSKYPAWERGSAGSGAVGRRGEQALIRARARARVGAMRADRPCDVGCRRQAFRLGDGPGMTADQERVGAPRAAQDWGLVRRR